MGARVIDNKKTVLIASDIFGISDSFLSLLDDTNITAHAVVVSPYQKTHCDFKSEQQAYQYFQDHGGIDAYILRLTDVIQLHKSITQFVGFSAGAAALYRVMSNLRGTNAQLTLFYPSQIRYFLDKQPSCACHIIFPESEPHFSLPDVIKVLKQYPQLQIEQNVYQHGFMNKNSKAYNPTAYKHYCEMLYQSP